jgi:transposase
MGLVDHSRPIQAMRASSRACWRVALEPIHVPPPDIEAARDLVRAREDARVDRMRDRLRLANLCLRQRRTPPTQSWGVSRRKWLSEQRFEFTAQQAAFDTYVHALDLVDRRIEALEQAIRQASLEGRGRGWSPACAACAASTR